LLESGVVRRLGTHCAGEGYISKKSTRATLSRTAVDQARISTRSPATAQPLLTRRRRSRLFASGHEYGTVGTYFISPHHSAFGDPPSLAPPVILMSNKDYFAQQQPQQPYYPPQGAIFSHVVIAAVPLTGVSAPRATAWSRSRLLPPAASAVVPAGLWWSAWLSATATASTGLCVRLKFLPGCWSNNPC
jgi:hypothetical protein